MSTTENAEDFSPCWIRDCPEDSIVLPSILRNHTVTVTKWFPYVKTFLARTRIDLSLLFAGTQQTMAWTPLAGKIGNENPIFGRIMTDLNSLVVFATLSRQTAFQERPAFSKCRPRL